MIGEQVSHYVLRRRLGAGAYGEVYEGVHAHDPELRVAIKVVANALGGDARFVEALKGECRKLDRLDHPGIVRFRDLVVGDRVAMVLELLEGKDFDARLEQGPLAIDAVVRVLEAALDALAYAHRHGVLHRDIKPSNLFGCDDGRVKLLDFGVARAADGTQATKTGQLVGTLDYMAPERFTGQGGSAASDVYAMGLVAWELLAGVPACPDVELGAKMGWHILTGVRDVREVRPDCPAWLAEVVTTLAARDLTARPADGAAALALLRERRAAEGRPVPSPPREVPRPSEPAPSTPAPARPPKRVTVADPPPAPAPRAASPPPKPPPPPPVPRAAVVPAARSDPPAPASRGPRPLVLVGLTLLGFLGVVTVGSIAALSSHRSLLASALFAPEPASITFDGEAVVTVSDGPVPVQKATVLDADGNALDPQPTITWTIAPAGVAVFDGARIVPRGAGDAKVTAKVGVVTASYMVVVPERAAASSPSAQPGANPGIGAAHAAGAMKGEGGIGRIDGDPVILGALDKSRLDAVIKRNMTQIRYCYQRELSKDPTLAGRITVKFVIAKDGTVASATTKATTMGNPAVESCINGRFMRFQFPEPKGGGIVIVSYPFLFSPG